MFTGTLFPMTEVVTTTASCHVASLLTLSQRSIPERLQPHTKRCGTKG
jgi:hypothetical protein